MENKVLIECETEGFDEAIEKVDALVEAYDGFPPQVQIKNCHDCTINIYPSQTKIIEQTDLLVKTLHKSRESHEENCETCRDKDAYDEWQGNCDECENGIMYTPQTEREGE